MANGTEKTSRADDLKRALVAIRNLRNRVNELEQDQREPVAVVGQSCRLPGGADTPQKFWELIRDGVDATCDVPRERWDADAIYNPDPNALGGSYVKRGGFLREPIDRFDPGFFSISPREASAMDPMHRMMLELAWEALEDAGIPPFALENSLTGVFAGMSVSDYDSIQKGTGLQHIHSYRGTGTIASIATGRISHFLGLQGPNFPVDTACSSGLVAVALAVEQLRAGCCDLALAGAVSIMLSPEATVFLCRMQALDPDGRCRSFDASAAGYSRGEGGGIIALKRLSDARRDGNRILAVIRGVACNHDGHSSGLTVPNPAAQRKVIQAALRDAGISPLEIDYVEAHGTATELGDPIELRALSEVLCADRDPDMPLQIGAVKTNVGHLEAAAGITGVLKVVQALRHRQLPPHLHFETPTPHVDWNNLPLRVPTELTSWESGSGIRTAGVSAFGFSGTNAHVIIEEAPVVEDDEQRPDRPAHLIAISGRSKNAVCDLAGRYHAQIATADARELADLAMTSTLGRSHHTYRAFASGCNPQEVANSLLNLQQGDSAALTRAKHSTDIQIAFLFSGQGSQSAGMARELWESSPVFRENLEHCDQILRNCMDRELLPLLLDESESSNLNQTQFTQPALVAFEYALYQLWRSWGVEPAYVLGHSLGEYVAATVAGIFNLEEMLPLAALRGRLMQALSTPGQMAAVFAAEQVVAKAIEGFQSLSVAAFNSPENIVVSGEANVVSEISKMFSANDISVSDLKVSHAFHSPLMDPMLDEFEDAVRRLSLNAPRLPLISNLTGDLITDDEAKDAARWRRHIREPVRFSAGMSRLAAAGVNCFIEIGPHPTLSGLGMETVTGSDVQWLPSMRRNVPAWQQIAESVGKLYSAGYDVDWDGWQHSYRGRIVSGPLYPFQRDRYWYTDITGDAESGQASRETVANGVPAEHPLLGVSLQSPVIVGLAYQTVLRADRPGYLEDHRVHGRIVAPGAMFAEMMLGAAREGLGWEQVAVHDLVFERPLIVDDAGDTFAQVVVAEAHDGQAEVRVVSTQVTDGSDAWITHARATVKKFEDGPGPVASIDERTGAAQVPIDVAALYTSIEKRGIAYGDNFRALDECRGGADFAVGHASLSPQESTSCGAYLLHPCLLDAGFQLLAGIATDDDDETATRLPAGVEQIRLYRSLDPATRIHAVIREDSDDDLFLADITFFDERSDICAEIIGYSARKVDGSLLRQAVQGDDTESPQYRVDWRQAGEPGTDIVIGEPGTWLVFANDGHASTALAEYLENAGSRCIRVHADKEWAQFGDVYSLPRSCEESWSRFVESCGILDEPQRLRGVVNLWGINREFDENTAADDIVSPIQDSLVLLARLLEGGRLESGAPIRIVTQGAVGPQGAAPRSWPTGASLWATLSVLQAEHREFDYRAVDLDPGIVVEPEFLARALFGASEEDRLVIRDGRFYGPRLVRAGDESVQPDHRAVPQGENYRIDIVERGTIDALRYVPAERREPDADEVEIQVRATGLNFRDVLNVLGMYPGDPGPPGVEVVGIVTRAGANVTHVAPGDEVFGLGNGAFSGFITTPAAGVVRVPTGMSLEEAATIPLAFLTAEWGLNRLAGLSAGERVLIHAAAGGVGQAAVQLAQAAGAEVHATAGSEEKQEFLRRQGVTHIYSSRDPAFADEVLAATGGEGVDVVLNALTGEMLERSLSLLRAGGRFIELGKAELLDPDELAARAVPVEYSSFDLGSVLVETPDEFQDLFNGVVERFLSDELHPLRMVTYGAEQVVDAFRFMAQARHIGKVVIAGRSHLLNEGRGAVRADASYIVTGATGALGRALTEWLVENGAGAVVLNARSEPTEELQQWIARVRNAGSTIKWVAGDIAHAECAAMLVCAATDDGAMLAGVFHAAGVLDDGLLVDLDRDRIARVLAPKVAGAWHLHQATRRAGLDYFVLFSSIAATMAGAGQASYAAANGFLGALAERRRRSGLPSVAVEWGAWEGAGMAGRLSERERQALENRGMGFLEPEAAFRALAEILADASVARPIVARFDWSLVRRNMAAVPPMLSELLDSPSGGSSIASVTAAALEIDRLRDLDELERRSQIAAYVKSLLAAVLGARSDQLEDDVRLGDLGFDSLMAMELRNRIEKESGIVLPVGKLLGSTSVGGLSAAFDSLLELGDAAANEHQEQQSWDEGEI